MLFSIMLWGLSGLFPSKRVEGNKKSSKLISNATPTMPAAQRDVAEQADRTTPFLSSRIGYERKILGW